MPPAQLYPLQANQQNRTGNIIKISVPGLFQIKPATIPITVLLLKPQTPHSSVFLQTIVPDPLHSKSYYQPFR
jgi:hypothetical protein